MEIKCLGGTNEIGGNKILVEHKGTKIFLDFGKSFNQFSKYFSEFLNPRKSVGLKDFFELNLLPDIEGIYREDYLKHMGRSTEKRDLDAVFLSHAHADHAQYIHFLRKDIPIYCNKATYIILKVLEETGVGSFSDLVTTCDSFTFYRNEKDKLSKVTRRNKKYVKSRPFVIMEPEKPIQIGSLKLEMLPVDHSLPGASGCIIYSDEGNLAYTGDIRFHGYNAEKSKRFIGKTTSVNPKWMICEGTRIDKTEKDAEDEIEKEITKLISNTKGLVFVEHPIRDLDRVVTIFEASKKNRREFVVTPKLAYLIKSLGKICPFKLDDIKILIPLREWGLICSNRTDLRLIAEEFHPKREYKPWEQDLIWETSNDKRKNVITYRELQKNPDKYVVSINLWEINHLSDIKPRDAIWIKSSCEPFSDDMEIDEERKNNWLEHFNIKRFTAHASGHASGEEIKKMIKKINPEILIPIHTEHPEMLTKILPKDF
ncbi:MAG: MBL fold metallo-hydrolase [Thermoplasmatales archaeon]|nr:MAG: MBL fold metallo-hydrolase [Thermoplasmatales archaeon]